jgi:hypothetical protein
MAKLQDERYAIADFYSTITLLSKSLFSIAMCFLTICVIAALSKDDPDLLETDSEVT